MSQSTAMVMSKHFFLAGPFPAILGKGLLACIGEKYAAFGEFLEV